MYAEENGSVNRTLRKDTRRLSHDVPHITVIVTAVAGMEIAVEIGVPHLIVVFDTISRR